MSQELEQLIESLDGKVLAGNCDFAGASKRAWRVGGRLVVKGANLVYVHGSHEVRTWTITDLKQFTSRWRKVTKHEDGIELVIIPVRGSTSSLMTTAPETINVAACETVASQLMPMVDEYREEVERSLRRECPQCWRIQDIAGMGNRPDQLIRCANCGMSAARSAWMWEVGGRRVVGELLEVSGLPVIAGGGCTLVFHHHEIVVSVAGGGVEHVVPRELISSLRFAGRGELAASSGFQLVDGGFATDAAEARYAAGEWAGVAVTVPATRSRIESILVLEWEGGSVAVLNTKISPEIMAERLRPFVQRLQSETPDGGDAGESTADELMAHLRQLVEWREAGALTADEFVAAKAKLLG